MYGPAATTDNQTTGRPRPLGFIDEADQELVSDRVRTMSGGEVDLTCG